VVWHRITLAVLAIASLALAGPARAQDAPETASPPEVPGQPPGGESAPAGADEVAPAGAPEASDEAPEGAPDEAPGAAVPAAGASAQVPRETAATVADAPPADESGGYRVAPDGAGPGVIAWRIAGFVPYWATKILLTPVRGLMWVYERYALDVRFREVFFTADGTIGLFPLLTNEAGFGLSLGAKFLHNSLFGEGEKLSITATARGASQAFASLVANSGNRWRGFRLRGNVTYNSLRRARFDGIGNEDTVDIEDSGRITEPLDPFSNELAFDSRYSFDEFSVRLGADFALTDHLTVQVLGEYIRRDYDPNGDDAERYRVFTGDVYDTANLTGFEEGLNTIDGLLVLTYDRSGVASRYNSLAVRSRGYRATSLLGYAYGIGDDPSNFLRFSAALEGFINLYGGDRVLTLRAFYETVSADRADVPFDQLPTLGGVNLLRGYLRGRFRDSSVALASAEYSYPVLNTVSGFLFVDVGVPFAGLDDFSLDNPRVGYGAGVQLQNASAAFGRLDVSSSIDGGLLVNLTFQPFFRVDRRAQ